MVMLKTLKPYHIKTEKNSIRIILAYQYFSVEIKKKVFQFIPVEANEIKVCRQTKNIKNLDAVFAFQNGKDIINLPIVKLMGLPDFLDQIDEIAKPYYHNTLQEIKQEDESALNEFIAEMEQQNLLRLIDQSLDEGNKELFFELTDLL